MTREEAQDVLQKMKLRYISYDVDDSVEARAVDVAIEALERIGAIEGIINISNRIIQEDVLKYKMIVDVVKGDDK